MNSSTRVAVGAGGASAAEGPVEPVSRGAPRTLRDLYAEHGGKLSHKWTSYLAHYERLFAPYRDRPIRLLEIGVQNGGSLELWSRYFPTAARIVGCDIDQRCAQLAFDDPRISIVVADASSEQGLRAVRALSGEFDLVIDDGSHKSSDIIRAFAKYFPLLQDGGLYVCEDLCCGYWPEFEGGLSDNRSSVTFFKQLVDVVNHEHWRVSDARADVLRDFAARYAVQFDDGPLACVHSVEFANSLCIVRKAPPSDNSIGLQVAVGSVADVDAAPRSMHDLPMSALFPRLPKR